jgi:hypothetical protein
VVRPEIANQSNPRPARHVPTVWLVGRNRSSRGVRCRAQWVWNTSNTNAHSPRIHTVRVLRLISWIQIGQNPYIALPCTNRCGETSSQSIDLRIHSIGKIGNWCRSSSALISCSVTLKNFANAERAEGESWSSMKGVSVRLTASTKTDRDLRENWNGRKSGRQETADTAYR